jgi:hypothetical protein
VSLSCHNGKTVKILIHATPLMVEDSEKKNGYITYSEKIPSHS